MQFLKLNRREVKNKMEKDKRQELDDRYRKFWGCAIDKGLVSHPEEVLLYGIYEELIKLNKEIVTNKTKEKEK